MPGLALKGLPPIGWTPPAAVQRRTPPAHDPTAVCPSRERSETPEFSSSSVWIPGASLTLLNVMLAVFTEPAVGCTAVNAQRSSVTPSPDSEAPFQYSSGPGRRIGDGTENAPATKPSTYT